MCTLKGTRDCNKAGSGKVKVSYSPGKLLLIFSPLKQKENCGYTTQCSPLATHWVTTVSCKVPLITPVWVCLFILDWSAAGFTLKNWLLSISGLNKAIDFSKDRLYLTGLGLRLLLRRPILNLCIFPVLKGHLDEKEHQTASFMWWDKKKKDEFCNKAIQIHFSNFSLVSTELSDGSNLPHPHPSAKICKKERE